MNTHEVLVKARNLIDREGAAKGAYCGMDGYCAIGALITASGGVSMDCLILLGPDQETAEYEGSAREAFLSRLQQALAAYRLLDAVTPPVPDYAARIYGGSRVEAWWEQSGPEVGKAELLAVFDAAIAQSAPEPDLSGVTFDTREKVA